MPTPHCVGVSLFSPVALDIRPAITLDPSLSTPQLCAQEQQQAAAFLALM